MVKRYFIQDRKRKDRSDKGEYMHAHIHPLPNGPSTAFAGLMATSSRAQSKNVHAQFLRPVSLSFSSCASPTTVLLLMGATHQAQIASQTLFVSPVG